MWIPRLREVHSDCKGSRWTHHPVKLEQKQQFSHLHCSRKTITTGMVPRVIVRLDTRPERKYSVSLIFKTLVNRRCEFSAPISERPAHKFSVKINVVHVEKKRLQWWERLSLISDALIETRQQHHIALFWRLHGFHQWKEIPERSSEHKISFSSKTKLARKTSLFFTGFIPSRNYSFSSTCNGPLGSKVYIGPGCHSCILHTSS